MLETFLKQAAQYKELILLIVAIFGGIFFIRDYFATKHEVKVLQCQAENGLTLVESRVNVEQLTKRVLALKQDTAAAEETKKTSKPPKAQGIANTINALSQEIKKIDKELEDEYAKQRQATGNLKPGVCERAVSGK